MEKFFDSKSWQKFLSGKQDTHIWGEDFSGCVFEDCVFDSTVRFEQCKFRNARFKGVVFDGNTIKDCTFAQSVFTDSCLMKNVDAENVFFSSVDLGNTKFDGGKYYRCDFFSAKSEKVVFSGSEVFYECELRKGFGKAISSMKLRGFQPGQVFTRNQKGITLAQAIPRNRHFLQNKGLQADFIDKAPGIMRFVETCSTFTLIAPQEGKDFLLSDSGKEFYIPFSNDHKALKEFLEYYSPVSEPG